jgi:ketosteroid isomerase-like protein
VAADAELLFPSASPALYRPWAALWLEAKASPSSGDTQKGDEGPSHHSWTDRFLVGVVAHGVRDQAIQAESDGAASVRPLILAEPQLFADALPLLVRADPSRASRGQSSVARVDGALARVSELHDEVRRSWAALVASLPPPEQTKHESVFQSGYDAFQSGDLGAMQRWFAPDAVLTAPGRTPYSGTYRGLAEILALLAHSSDRLGIDSPELIDLVPEGDALHATFTTAVHSGSRSLSVRFRQLFWFNDEGQIVRSVLTFEDEERLNAFFGER